MNIVLLESLGIPDAVLEQYVQKLEANGHNFTAYSRDSNPAVVIQRALNADVVMLANMPMGAQVIDALPNLKFIDIAFTGVDHVDIAAARMRGIKVSNASGYSTKSVAELAIGMMISLMRNVNQTQLRCRAGGTKDGLVGVELSGKTVGIVGAGAIGQYTAKLARAFGCRVFAYNPRPKVVQEGLLTFCDLDTLLRESDVVSLHCPLNATTRGLMSKERIALMKPGAILLNLARGPVVDTQALADALHAGHLAGAGIDVFEIEPPLPTDHPLLHTPNTQVTPHIAFASQQSMLLRASIVFENLERFLLGDPINIVV